MTKPVIENFGMHPLAPSEWKNKVNHSLDNTKSDELDMDEKQFRIKYLDKNILLAGTCKNIKDIENQIQKAELEINNTRHKYPLREFVMTLNIDYNHPQKDEIVQDWAKEVVEFWENKGATLMLGNIHMNEGLVVDGKLIHSNPHMHLFFQNWGIGAKSKKMKWGWELGSIKPHQLRKLHREYDDLLHKFSKKWNLEHLTRDEVNVIKTQNGKHLDVWEYKKIKKEEYKKGK